MPRIGLTAIAALLLASLGQANLTAQLLCEQRPGCATYPSMSLSDGEGTESGEGEAPVVTPEFAVNEQFGSFGGDSFVSTDASMIGDLLGPRIFFGGRAIVGPSQTSRFKLADNQSPMPRNRVFYNYSHFHNAVDDMAAGNTAFNVDRHVFGFEKTFLDGLTSFEIRIPFANTGAADQVLTTGGSFFEATEFGNIQTATKVLLVNRQRFAMSAGLASVLPSAPNLTLNDTTTNTFTEVQNDSWTTGPFMGFILRPTSRWTLQSVVQLSFDTNGNDVTQIGPNNSVTFADNFRDHNLFMATLSSAYWLRQNRRDALVSDLAGILELHYTSSMSNGDIVGGDGYERRSAIIATEAQNVDILNLTAGAEFRFGAQNSLIIGAGVPLRDAQADRLFSTEVLLQYNRFF